MSRFVLVLFLVFAGCQSLFPEGGSGGTESVRIVEDEAAVADCEQVAEVTVAPPFPFLKRAIPEASIGVEETRRDLRYQARLVGGDTVLRTGVQEGMTQGTVYDCE